MVALSRKKVGIPWGLLRELAIDIVLLVVVYLGHTAVCGHYQVVGRSMFPTLDTGQHVLVERVTTRLGRVQRGDIVVLLPTAGQEHDLIKRVIGLPGEIIEIKGIQVIVNGRVLDEPYAAGYLGAGGSWTLGPDQYFLMGDNRGVSADSRAWGPVHRDALLGNAVAVVWPPQAATFLDRPEYLMTAPLVQGSAGDGRASQPGMRQ